MVNYFVYAWDCSISPLHSEHCRTNGLNTFEQFKRDEENIKRKQLVAEEPPTASKTVVLHWSENSRGARGDETISEYVDLINEWVERKPEWIIRCLKDDYMVNKDDKIKLLYIVTNGVIGNEKVKKCVELNEDMHYETVVFHALKKDLERIDLSIAVSFFKSRCFVYRNYELCYGIDISKGFDYDKINAHNFSTEKCKIKFYIKLKFINKFRQDASASQEIDKLLKLKGRLSQEVLSRRLDYSFRKTYSEAMARNVPMPVVGCTEFWNRFDATSQIEEKVEKFVAALIEYINSNEQCYSFGTLKCDMKVDSPVAEEPMDDAGS